jgi:hypothetical protein
MRKFALIAAAACLLAGPALMQPASAETASVRIGIGDSGARGRVVVRDNDNWRHQGYRSYARERVVISSNPRHCRTVTTRIHRANGSVVIKKQRRCV